MRAYLVGRRYAGTTQKQMKRMQQGKKMEAELVAAEKSFNKLVKELQHSDWEDVRTQEQKDAYEVLVKRYAKNKLKKDRETGLRFKKFLNLKMVAVNELPPHLREKALEPDFTPFPQTAHRPALTPAHSE